MPLRSTRMMRKTNAFSCTETNCTIRCWITRNKSTRLEKRVFNHLLSRLFFNPRAQNTTTTQQQTPKDKSLEIPGGEQIPAGFKPSKPLEKLTPHERELEIRAHNSQLEQQRLYMQEASPFMKSQEDARLKRQEKAVGWFGETIGRWVT